jgi:hypothetical protein
MLLVGNSGASTFKVLPQCLEQGILYQKSLILTVAEFTPRKK